MLETAVDALALEGIDALSMASREEQRFDANRLLGEVTRGGIGHLRVRLVAIIRYRPLEATAAQEHVIRFLATPCLVASDGAETRATHEHAYHIGYLRGVEAIEVEIG